jgi:thioredoxin reductase (NADPH)
MSDDHAKPASDGVWDVIIVGGGIAGLSAAIYLGRAQRKTLIVDSGKSLASWEPHVENFLGFPDSISGDELLSRGKQQCEKYGVAFEQDEIHRATRSEGQFQLTGKKTDYRAKRVLLATGLYHLPPDVPGVKECLGNSMFFCKDCDAFRVRTRRIAIIGRNNEAVEYALGMLLFSSCVVVASNGKTPHWDEIHTAWMKEYEIPLYPQRIIDVQHKEGQLFALTFENGECMAADCVFTTRGDIYYNELARQLGAELDAEGQTVVNALQETSIPGLYAAGCITPANCQMIVAAGQGATAAQAINRDLFQESLRTHSLRQLRLEQLAKLPTRPEIST